jgi:hypothetical protein
MVIKGDRAFPRILCAPKSTINDNESHLNEKWQLQCENSAPITFLRGSKLSAHQKSFTAQMALCGLSFTNNFKSPVCVLVKLGFYKPTPLGAICAVKLF